MMNNTTDDNAPAYVTVANLKLSQEHAYKVGGMESLLKSWIAEGEYVPGLESLTAENRKNLKDFIHRQLSIIEANAKSFSEKYSQFPGYKPTS